MTKTPHKPVYECSSPGCSLPVRRLNGLCKTCADGYAPDGRDAESAVRQEALAMGSLGKAMSFDPEFLAEAMDTLREGD